MNIRKLLSLACLLPLAVVAQEAKTVPYTMGFEYGTTDGIKIVDVNGKTGENGQWKVKLYTGSFMESNYAHTGYGALVYFYDSKRSADDWAFLDPVRMKAGKYCIRFYYCNQSNVGTDEQGNPVRYPHPERVSLAYGTSATPEAMTTEVVRYDPFDVDGYTESLSIIDIPSDGVYYFGFHAFSDKDENALMIDDVSITAVESSDNDLAIETLAEPAHDVACAQYEDLMFQVTNKGSIKTDATIKVWLDDEADPHEMACVTIGAQQTDDEQFNNWFKQLKPGMHKLTIKVTTDSVTDPDTTNNTLVRSVMVLDDYTHRWDAEGGAIENDLTIQCYDKKTLNAALDGDFPNGVCWNVVNINKHDIFGEYMYDCGTWFTDAEPTPCDRWLVLPEVQVNGDDAYFTWIAGSYNEKYLDNYSIMVSTNGDDKDAFAPVQIIEGEAALSKGRLQPRGVSLADYQGKTIRLAIRVTTADGEMAVFDNLSLYGNVIVTDPTAIVAVEASSDGVNKTIYNLNGQRINRMQRGINIVDGRKVLK